MNEDRIIENGMTVGEIMNASREELIEKFGKSRVDIVCVRALNSLLGYEDYST